MRAAKQNWLECQTAASVIVLSLLAALALAIPRLPSTTERSGWRLASSWKVLQDGSVISGPSYDASKWLPVPAMPATVLEIFQEDGVYLICILDRI